MNKLSTQLAALRGAVARALEHQMPQSATPNENENEEKEEEEASATDDEQDEAVDDTLEDIPHPTLDDLRGVFANSFADALNAEQAPASFGTTRQEA